ncbi:MAG TPA: O-antigen ligase family protein [Candidatus Acidoferrales bacterium]|nr:O-antigen ligase family protein [Candidatus Acidoferrales bacterium]
MRMKSGNHEGAAAHAQPARALRFPKRNDTAAFEFSASRAAKHELAVTQVFLFALITATSVAVIFFGGTETISWAVVQIILLAVGVALLLAELRQPVPWREWIVPAALLVWIAVQWRAPFAAVASYDRWETGELFVRLLVYGSAFAAARRVARDDRASQRLIFALLALGLAEAAYGLAQSLAGWQKILWYERVYYRESATGTFVNHNHFAGFLEMVIPFAVARAMAATRTRAGERVAGKAALHLFAAAVLILAVIFSQSRMGLIACVVSLVTLAVVLRLGSRRFAPSATFGVGIILLLLIASAALMLWTGPEPVFERFAQLPAQQAPGAAGGRPAVWADTLRLIGERPLAGVGLGAFAAAYTKVQTVEVNARVDFAHNDYLQTAAELGLPAALLFWAMILALAARTARASWTSASLARRIIALGATGALAALLLHSLTDFNLYIPANGLVFAVVLGLGSGNATDV